MTPTPTFIQTLIATPSSILTPHPTLTSFTIYGAIISTVSIIISIVSIIIALLAYRRDNPKIKVKVTNGFLLPSSLDEGIKFFINVINQGRRPVTITNTGFLLNNGTTIIMFQPIGANFPHELTEGQKLEAIYDKNELIKVIKE